MEDHFRNQHKHKELTRAMWVFAGWPSSLTRVTSEKCSCPLRTAKVFSIRDFNSGLTLSDCSIAFLLLQSRQDKGPSEDDDVEDKDDGDEED